MIKKLEAFEKMMEDALWEARFLFYGLFVGQLASILLHTLSLSLMWHPIFFLIVIPVFWLDRKYIEGLRK